MTDPLIKIMQETLPNVPQIREDEFTKTRWGKWCHFQWGGCLKAVCIWPRLCDRPWSKLEDWEREQIVNFKINRAGEP